MLSCMYVVRMIRPLQEVCRSAAIVVITVLVPLILQNVCSWSEDWAPAHDIANDFAER